MPLKSNDTMVNVQKWTDSIEKENGELQRLHDEEQKARKGLFVTYNLLNAKHYVEEILNSSNHANKI